MKILVYSDGQPSSVKALQFAARLVQSLGADLAVITVRSGTHAIEPLPPYGRQIELADASRLPPGLQVMAHARQVLADEGLFNRQAVVQVRELPNGHLLACHTTDGRRVPFYVCFGHMVETLNHEIEKHRYDLLIIAPPPRGRLHRLILGDISRRLVLDVRTSVLIVRGGRADSRFVVCADGSAAARRQFPMLKRLLPAILPPLEFICVRTMAADDEAVQNAHHCLEQAEQWLTACGKTFKVHRLEGERPVQVITAIAGPEAVIVVGASLRHDVYRRLRGSLPIQILSHTAASTLVVKALPEDSPGDLHDSKTCQSSGQEDLNES